jgi:hypothetical protein
MPDGSSGEQFQQPAVPNPRYGVDLWVTQGHPIARGIDGESAKASPPPHPDIHFVDDGLS